MKLVYRVPSLNATISLEADDPNEDVPIQIEAGEAEKKQILDILERSHGALGHTLGDRTNLIDLHASTFLEPLKSLNMILIEGELPDEYDFGLPEGVCS
jgi:hypothetical protein